MRASVPDISDLVGDRGGCFLEGAGEHKLVPDFSSSFDDGAGRCYVGPPSSPAAPRSTPASSVT
eukprot:7633511-Pyramimonas_sp.AAC.1